MGRGRRPLAVVVSLGLVGVPIGLAAAAARWSWQAADGAAGAADPGGALLLLAGAATALLLAWCAVVVLLACVEAFRVPAATVVPRGRPTSRTGRRRWRGALPAAVTALVVLVLTGPPAAAGGGVGVVGVVGGGGGGGGGGVAVLASSEEVTADTGPAGTWTSLTGTGTAPQEGSASAATAPDAAGAPPGGWTPPPRGAGADVRLVGAATDRTSGTPGTGTVVVVRGDTLWGLVERHLGGDATAADVAVEWPRWYEANRAAIGADPDLLLPGTELRVPS